MNNFDTNLVLSFAIGNISEKEFIDKFPLEVVGNYNLFNDLLSEASQKRNSEFLECVLILGFKFELFTTSCLPYLEKLIVEKWHISHENLAMILQQLKSPSSVESLYKAATLHLPYLDYDDNYALARRCLWALGSINTEEAKEMIKKLAHSDEEEIRNHAQEQINRLGM